MSKKTFRLRFLNIPTLVFCCLLLSLQNFAQQNKPVEKSFADFYEEFNRAKSLPCGTRDEAIRAGREIVRKFGARTAQYPLVVYVKDMIPFLEVEEEICKKNLPASDTAIHDRFLETKKAPCGQRDEALRLAKYLVIKLNPSETSPEFIGYLKKQIQIIEEEDNKCKENNSLETLFEIFRTARKAGCGKRAQALGVGKKILELHGADELNQEIIRYVEKEIPKIEREDYTCQRNELYNEAYRTKNWRLFFAVSKRIITEEGDSPMSLDVMLTWAAVGHRLTAYTDENFYNTDTVFYAKKAIELIEAGTETQARWGFFEQFKSKENALGWLHYIVGYIGYFRLGEDKKAIPYFYKSTRYKTEFKYDAFIYHAVAIYYFDREATTASNLTINEFIFRATTLVNPAGERTGNTFGDASADDEIIRLHKNLVNLYNLRYNLTENETIGDLADYIQKLINRPLIDPSAGVKKRK